MQFSDIDFNTITTPLQPQCITAPCVPVIDPGGIDYGKPKPAIHYTEVLLIVGVIIAAVSLYKIAK